ncbi:TPA: hypothetical protein ACPZUA_003882 [Yersinia enterocolitica]
MTTLTVPSALIVPIMPDNFTPAFKQYLVQLSSRVSDLSIKQSGWTAATGTAYLGSFDASAAYAVGATYSQSQVTAIANGLTITRQRVKALEDILRKMGWIE